MRKIPGLPRIKMDILKLTQNFGEGEKLGMHERKTQRGTGKKMT